MHRALALACVLLASAAGVDAQTLRERMLLAEDARPQTAEGLAPLMEGVKAAERGLRRQAVRALGRLERPELVPAVAAALADAVPAVRREAFNALAQLAHTGSAAAEVQARILDAMPSERDATVWGTAAAALGRLAYADAALVTRAEQAIAPVLPASSGRSARPALSGSPDAMLGATRGLEALGRISRTIAPLSPAAIERLRNAAALTAPGDADRFARIRRFAWLALTPAGAVDAALVEAGIADADEEVRRLAVAAAGADTPLDGRQAFLEKALADASPRVRYEAVRSWGRRLQDTSCGPIRAALRDASAHVRLQAIDLLGGGCADQSPAGSLRALAEALTPASSAWHAPVHALAALARVAPDAARTLLPRFVTHGTWQVRMYAARAAGTVGAIDVLETLARDAHDNVREAALAAFVALKRPEAIPVALDALATRGDYQLLRTAARTLIPPDPTAPSAAIESAPSALVAALSRVSSERRETSRDARMAMLDALEALGPVTDAETVGALGARLADFDPLIAARAAAILGAWTGTTVKASPRPLPRPPLTMKDVPDVRLRVSMAGGGTFTMRLFVDEAPLTVHRILTGAKQGYYDGLTFHRVVPNFVIQGGSPGANEYVGDGPFMRDEVGLVSHTRGTVGISTRGRDTGDAQIFVNLVDLARLDHIYTAFAEVVDGMAVVDGILEGDVIARVDVVGPR